MIDWLLWPIARTLAIVALWIWVAVSLCQQPGKTERSEGVSRLVLGLLLIASIGVLIRMYWVPFQLRVFTDEYLYLRAGRLIAEQGFVPTELYAKPLGWPALLAVAFKLFGPSMEAARGAVLLCSAVTVFGMGLLAFRVSGSRATALLVASAAAFWPTHLLFSGGVETNIPALALLVLVGVAVTRGRVSVWVCAALLGVAGSIRLELLILYPLLPLLQMERGKGEETAVRLWSTHALPLMVPLLLLLPELLTAIQLQRETAVASAGLSASISAFGGTILHYEPHLLLALPLAGWGVWRGKGGFAGYGLIVFGLLTLIYLVAGFDRIAWPARMLLPLTGVVWLSLARLFRKSGWVFPVMAALLAATWFIPTLVPRERAGPHVSVFTAATDRIDSATLQTRIAEEAWRDVPANCAVVSNRPEVVTALAATPVALKEELLKGALDPEKRCILLLWDYTCADLKSDPDNSFCLWALDKFAFERVREYHLGHRTYGYVRLTGPRRQGAR